MNTTTTKPFIDANFICSVAQILDFFSSYMLVTFIYLFVILFFCVCRSLFRFAHLHTTAYNENERIKLSVLLL